MKKVTLVAILIALLISGYTGYNLFLQNKADHKFICDCRDLRNTSGVLLFDIQQDPGLIKSMKIRLNTTDIPLDSTKIYGSKKSFTYQYDNRFNTSDTITISIANKRYIVCGFKNDTVIVNDKKGLECKLKSAKINGATQNGNRYKLL